MSISNLFGASQYQWYQKFWWSWSWWWHDDAIKTTMSVILIFKTLAQPPMNPDDPQWTHSPHAPRPHLLAAQIIIGDEEDLETLQKLHCHSTKESSYLLSQQGGSLARSSSSFWPQQEGSPGGRWPAPEKTEMDSADRSPCKHMVLIIRSEMIQIEKLD